MTRPIARRRTRELFDLVAGFVYSQVLFACVRLGLLEAISQTPQTAGQLAHRLNLPVESAQRLLSAACALRLAAERSGGRYGLGDLGAALIANPGVVAMVEHHALLYEDLRDPVGLLRDTEQATNLSRYWAYSQGGPAEALSAESTVGYSALMAQSQTLIANQVLDAYPLSRHRCLLDVGGGEGAFVMAAASRAPGLDFILFDLPAVADRAHQRFAARGLSDRVATVGGDFFNEPLPSGADIISLVRIVHDHDDKRALDLLKAVRGALPHGGTLLLAEPMAGTSGAAPAGAAYFGFYLLAMRSGRPRTEAELRSMLGEAGYRRIRAVATATPLLTRLIVAEA